MDANFRINQYPPYVFSIVSKLKDKVIESGKTIIDLGMGNPDGATPDHIVEALLASAKDKANHRYNDPRGIDALRAAICDWYQQNFNVNLDHQRETIVTLGSKEGLAHLALALCKDGDVVLAPTPAYPIHHFGFQIAGAKLVPYQVGNQADMFEQITTLCETHKPKIVLLNFPSNPTADVVDQSFFEQMVKLAKQHQFWVIHDFAYADIYFDQRPPSILSIKGSKDVAVESYSLSKSYNMPGWRVGFMSGNKLLISALTQLKAYYDYGLFTPIQHAAIQALRDTQSCQILRDIYKKRRDYLCQGLQDLGWPVTVPHASMFVWAKIPEKFAHLGSMEFTKQLLEQANVAVSPGVGFGQAGDQFVRLALIEDEPVIKQALKQMKPFIQQGKTSGNQKVSNG